MSGPNRISVAVSTSILALTSPRAKARSHSSLMASRLPVRRNSRKNVPDFRIKYAVGEQLGKDRTSVAGIKEADQSDLLCEVAYGTASVRQGNRFGHLLPKSLRGNGCAVGPMLDQMIRYKRAVGIGSVNEINAKLYGFGVRAALLPGRGDLPRHPVRLTAWLHIRAG
jgi:hypothetical protein